MLNKPGRYGKFIRILHLIGDLLLINLCFLLAYRFKFHSFFQVFDAHYFELYLFFNGAWVAAAFVIDVYDTPRVSSNWQVLLKLGRFIVLHALIITAFWVLLKRYYYSREHLILTYALLTVVLVLWRLIFAYLLAEYRSKGFNYTNVVVVGGGEIGERIKGFFLQQPEYGYHYLGFFSDIYYTPIEQQTDFLGPLANLELFLKTNHVDELYLALPSLSTDETADLIQMGEQYATRVKLLPDLRGLESTAITMEFYDTLPVFSVRSYPLDDIANRLAKRAFDVVFACLFFALIGFWLFPLLALVVRLSSRGPVFFRQRRSGMHGKNFWVYKFRTMHVNAEADSIQASANDKRIFPLGSFMRRTNLDELPQFYNVLEGTMSVVGPRPHMLRHTEEYSQLVDKYMVRHFIKPGLTGLAQVRGYRGATPTVQFMKNRVRMDLFYLANWSLLLDSKIIALTLINMIRGEKNAV